MRSRTADEASAVETTETAAKPRRPVKKAPATKTPAERAPAKPGATRRRATPSKVATVAAAPSEAPIAPAPATSGRGARKTALPLALLLTVVTAVAAIIFVLVRGDDPAEAIPTGVPVVVSAEELGSLDTVVYWAGKIESRNLELTSTSAGTFVRYLPFSVPAGDSSLALTIATYRLRNAYATAVRRAKTEGMTSRRTDDGRIAVWNRERPTSVYVAARGVPDLVEIYAPKPAEALALALSGRIRPVR